MIDEVSAGRSSAPFDLSQGVLLSIGYILLSYYLFLFSLVPDEVLFNVCNTFVALFLKGHDTPRRSGLWVWNLTKRYLCAQFVAN